MNDFDIDKEPSPQYPVSLVEQITEFLTNATFDQSCMIVAEDIDPRVRPLRPLVERASPFAGEHSPSFPKRYMTIRCLHRRPLRLGAFSAIGFNQLQDTQEQGLEMV